MPGVSNRSRESLLIEDIQDPRYNLAALMLIYQRADLAVDLFL